MTLHIVVAVYFFMSLASALLFLYTLDRREFSPSERVIISGIMGFAWMFVIPVILAIASADDDG